MGDAVGDEPAVDFELAFAGAAEKAEAAALPLEMGPGTHQPRALIGQRRELDLQASLMGAGARAENLQDEAGAVDDLAFPVALEIALLHRGQPGVDDNDRDLLGLDRFGEVLNGAAADEGRGPPLGDTGDLRLNHIERDRAREADRLLEAHLRRSTGICLACGRGLETRMDDEAASDRPLAAGCRSVHAVRLLQPPVRARRAESEPPASPWRSRACRRAANGHRGAGGRRNYRTR